MKTFNERQTIRRLVQEQKPKTGMHVRVRIFRLLPSFPWLEFNPRWLEKGKIISEKVEGGEKTYTVRFGDRYPYFHTYPVEAIEILPETK